MKYLNRFLQAHEKPLTKPTQPGAETGFVSFVSANDARPSSELSAPPIQASEQLQRIRALSQRVAPKELQRALKRIRPQINLNAGDRLELALSLALLDADIDPARVLEDVPQD